MTRDPAMRHIMCVLRATHGDFCRSNAANHHFSEIKCSIGATALSLANYSKSGTHTTQYAARAPL